MSETTALNRPRLIHLAEWLGAQKARMDLGLPSEWEQGHWLVYVNGELEEETGCGTACCIAGKVALEDGGIPVEARYDGVSGFTPIGVWTPEVGDSANYVVFGKDADISTAVPVDEYACKALGLDSDQADALFDEDNSYDDAIDYIRRILNGEL